MALTQARLKEVLDYSPETGLFYWRERRGSKAAGSQSGVIGHDGARLIRVDGVLCDTASDLKGAYRDKKRWSSRIYADGRNYFLGSFDTAQEAASAYDAAARHLHGEFARTNEAA